MLLQWAISGFARHVLPSATLIGGFRMQDAVDGIW